MNNASKTLNFAWFLAIPALLFGLGSLILLHWADYPGASIIGVAMGVLGLVHAIWGGILRFSLGWNLTDHASELKK
jgi:hypothetical protein